LSGLVYVTVIVGLQYLRLSNKVIMAGIDTMDEISGDSTFVFDNYINLIN